MRGRRAMLAAAVHAVWAGTFPTYSDFRSETQYNSAMKLVDTDGLTYFVPMRQIAAPRNASLGNETAPVPPTEKAKTFGAGALLNMSHTWTVSNTGKATVPFIALTSCHRNTTQPSQLPGQDFVYNAYDMGAQSVIFYTLEGTVCSRNVTELPETPIPLFTMILRDAKLVVSRLGPTIPRTLEYLNTKHDDTLRLLREHDWVTESYDAPASNVTEPSDKYKLYVGAIKHATSEGSLDSSSGTSSALKGIYALAAIIAVITAILASLLIWGLVQSARHPERYAPRGADDPLGPPQSRAKGLGKAILDTIPVMRYHKARRYRDEEASHSYDQSSSHQDICPICLDELKNNDKVRVLVCPGSHTFHRSCIDPWLLSESKVCPLCRFDLSEKSVSEPAENHDDKDDHALNGIKRFRKYVADHRARVMRSRPL